MPAAIRSASIWVLPEPAPASTSRFVWRSSRMLRREGSSDNGFVTPAPLRMGGQPSERLQRRVPQRAFRLRVDCPAARSFVVAPLARALVCGMNERAVDDEAAQVAEYRSCLRKRRSRDMNPLTAALVAGE